LAATVKEVKFKVGIVENDLVRKLQQAKSCIFCPRIDVPMLIAERLITYQGDAKRRKEPLSNQLKYNTMKVWLFYFLCYLRHEPNFW
jgi:hypothetical protein